MFFLPPEIQVALVLTIFAISTNLIFSASERNILSWLNNELDEEMELITLFESGKLSDSQIGNYINKIKTKFETLVLFDMICLIKLNIELSMQLKINMMLQINNLEIPNDEDLPFKLKEYKRIRRYIGKTALLALKPIMNNNSKDIWKLNQFLNNN